MLQALRRGDSGPGPQSATMATTTSNMFLYSLTLQPPTTISQAIIGQFSGTKEQQILTVSGSRLALLRPDPTLGRVITLLAHDVFGIIRAIDSFRLAGSSKGMFLVFLSVCSSYPVPTVT